MQTRTAGKRRTPGATAWISQAFALFACLAGLNALFFIPLANATWGIISVRKAEEGDKKSWLVYIAIAIMLSIIMVTSLLFLDPLGGLDKVNDMKTGWEPAR